MQISTISGHFRKPEIKWFSDELHKLAKDAFGVAAQPMIEHILYGKMPPHLKELLNQVYLENGL